MSFCVYIIQSRTTNRYYCGYSSNIERRLQQHNDPKYQLSKTTKRVKGPWNFVWTQKTSTRAEAMTLEKKIKNRGIARYLKSSVG
jgi:putative endonuclease